MTYSNYYNRDIRTPETYYENKGIPKQRQYAAALNGLQPSLEELNKQLEVLTDALHSIRTSKRAKQKPSPAVKKILHCEIDKAEMQRYKQQSKENAMKAIEAIINGTTRDAADALTEALEYKIFCRVEPYMCKAGNAIEKQVFRRQ